MKRKILKGKKQEKKEFILLFAPTISIVAKKSHEETESKKIKGVN